MPDLLPARPTAAAEASSGPPLHLLPRHRRASWIALLVVAAGGLVLGGATSPAQTWLPGAFSSVANSASGWTAVVALLVHLTRRSALLVTAVCGVVGFEALDLGYQIVSTARGYAYSGEFWAVVALVAGPVVGVAASWLHRRDRFAALGVAVLAAIGLGDGITGVLLLPTTSPVYWVLVGCGALALLTVTCLRRLESTSTRLLAILGAAAGSALYCLVLSVVFR